MGSHHCAMMDRYLKSIDSGTPQIRTTPQHCPFYSHSSSAPVGALPCRACAFGSHLCPSRKPPCGPPSDSRSLSPVLSTAAAKSAALPAFPSAPENLAQPFSEGTMPRDTSSTFGDPVAVVPYHFVLRLGEPCTNEKPRTERGEQ